MFHDLARSRFGMIVNLHCVLQILPINMCINFHRTKIEKLLPAAWMHNWNRANHRATFPSPRDKWVDVQQQLQQRFKAYPSHSSINLSRPKLDRAGSGGIPPKRHVSFTTPKLIQFVNIYSSINSFCENTSHKSLSSERGYFPAGLVHTWDFGKVMMMMMVVIR